MISNVKADLVGRCSMFRGKQMVFDTPAQRPSMGIPGTFQRPSRGPRGLPKAFQGPKAPSGKN